MNANKKSIPQSIKVTIGGDVNEGQVAVGSNITMTKTIQPQQPVLSTEEAQEVELLIRALREQVRMEAVEEQKAEALEQVRRLEESVHTAEPDMEMLQHVWAWFKKHMPFRAVMVAEVIEKFGMEKLAAH